MISHFFLIGVTISKVLAYSVTSGRHATSQHDVMTSQDDVIMSGSIGERCQLGKLLLVA